MKILNLYAGIGGNRKLWGNDYEITAVEYDSKIAKIYKDYFPSDTVIIEDAHQYLLDHYKEFDFIWASPPCPTHSQVNHFLNAQGIIRYPDMALYQEIIFLQHFYNGKYCIENVKPYYEPLIPSQISGRHYFWANFTIPKMKIESTIPKMKIESTIGSMKNDKSGKRTESKNHHKLGFDLSKIDYPNKKKLLNNCVNPEIGLAILNRAMDIQQDENKEQMKLF